MTMNRKTVLITGATSGIGAHTARLLIERGHCVAVTGRNEGKLRAFVDAVACPDQLLGIIADAADWDATQAAVDRTVERFGALDAAVANAGFTAGDHLGTTAVPIADGDPALWPPMVLTNVLGPALLAKAALPHLRETRGRLVLIGSVAGLKNAPGNLYSATKWAVTGLAENIRLHATTLGVGVTLVAPGMTDTPFWADGTAPPFAMPAEPVAEAIRFALDQPDGVDLNTLTIRPIGQPV
ncbi:SDR family NAD(P)-dependent oxidoreductase [Streptomyces rubrisoli]|uniref:SDR family NAD(P)-dependent oxidoreductase n=2 Tax=Streptantibioticus rubrisoli TaxID=1387313 RepID=A0ABT1PEH0_9ACTN|nr:SDR family NAD(P)-dependent oxidoreductase [Streptantibioticus rubrisoli]MCQ4043760.1 SDR family NAD(P)-dependent oxidoreductase [Streptantibioticus rubrisoli]